MKYYADIRVEIDADSNEDARDQVVKVVKALETKNLVDLNRINDPFLLSIFKEIDGKIDTTFKNDH